MTDDRIVPLRNAKPLEKASLAPADRILVETDARLKLLQEPLEWDLYATLDLSTGPNDILCQPH